MSENQPNSDGADLSGSLKKSDRGQAPSGVDFVRTSTVSPNSPRIITWLVTHSRGLVTSEKQAGYIVLVLGAIAIAVAFFLVSQGGTKIRTGGRGPSLQELEEYRKIQPF